LASAVCVGVEIFTLELWGSAWKQARNCLQNFYGALCDRWSGLCTFGSISRVLWSNRHKKQRIVVVFCKCYPPYMALLARLWKSLKALTSLGDLLLKLATHTLLERSLAAASSVLSPLNLWTSRMSRHSMLVLPGDHQSLSRRTIFLRASYNTPESIGSRTHSLRPLLITRIPSLRRLFKQLIVLGERRSLWIR
jgi:hypothetical protein